MTETTPPQPQVGIGVLVFKDGKLLLHRRKGSLGNGEYSAIGGHLEFGESFVDGVKREAREEAGIEIDSVRFLNISNTITYQKKHYVDISLAADWKSGEPQVLEPEKCESWGWYNLDNLPKNLFSSLALAVEACKTGKNFFDA